METGLHWIEQYGYGGLFVLLMLGVLGLPVSDETLLVFAGYLSSKGTLRIEGAFVAAFLGSVTGISLSYAIGRLIGLPALEKFGHVVHMRPEHLASSRRWVERWGKYSLLVAYFIPGVRHLAALLLGASMLPAAVFARFAYAGALAWSASFIGLGYVAGEEWTRFSPLIHRTLTIVILLVLLALSIALSAFLIRRAKL
ncbi:MAG: DedA family protein [Nitrospira sp.]|nr:DedA family protein [Nitrospira sp.]